MTKPKHKEVKGGRTNWLTGAVLQEIVLRRLEHYLSLSCRLQLPELKSGLEMAIMIDNKNVVGFDKARQAYSVVWLDNDSLSDPEIVYPIIDDMVCNLIKNFVPSLPKGVSKKKKE